MFLMIGIQHEISENIFGIVNGRAESKYPGVQSNTLCCISHPVIHCGNSHTMQQNMLSWHFQK
jgi:hypothetical protein